MIGEYDSGYETCIDTMVRQMEGMQYQIDSLHMENAKLRELVAEIWPIAEYAGYEHELSRARELMRELGYEED